MGGHPELPSSSAVLELAALGGLVGATTGRSARVLRAGSSDADVLRSTRGRLGGAPAAAGQAALAAATALRATGGAVARASAPAPGAAHSLRATGTSAAGATSQRSTALVGRGGALGAHAAPGAGQLPARLQPPGGALRDGGDLLGET